jgi:hypothetical protein
MPRTSGIHTTSHVEELQFNCQDFLHILATLDPRRALIDPAGARETPAATRDERR